MGEEEEKIIEDYLKKGKVGSSYKAFLDLFRAEKSEKQIKQRMKEDWDTLSPEEYSSVNLKPILHKIHFVINSEASNRSTKYRFNHILKWYSKVAAILLLPLLAVGVYYFLEGQKEALRESLVEVVAPMGSRIKTQLPDGTVTWLNSGTVLSYSIPFDKRAVKVEGEAFFDVATDSLNPFFVNGIHGAVKVFGTRFNVKMWPDEYLTEVVLEEGKVKLFPKGFEESFSMSPGEMLVYNSRDNTLNRKMVNAERYSAWIDGKLILRGESMEELGRELSRWFNVDVVIGDTALRDYTFRATFEDEELEDVLRLLKITSPLKYEIIDNQQDCEGEFSRKKVIIHHN